MLPTADSNAYSSFYVNGTGRTRGKTYNGDPVAVAQELRDADVKAIVNIIGLPPCIPSSSWQK